MSDVFPCEVRNATFRRSYGGARWLESAVVALLLPEYAGASGSPQPDAASGSNSDAGTQLSARRTVARRRMRFAWTRLAVGRGPLPY